MKRDEIKVRDIFKDLINVWWEIMAGIDGDRSHKLTFHRHTWIGDCNRNLYHVMEEGKNRGQEQEDEAIHQKNCDSNK